MKKTENKSALGSGSVLRLLAEASAEAGSKSVSDPVLATMELILFFFVFILDRMTKVIAFMVFPDALVFNSRAFFFFGDSFAALVVFFVIVSLLCWWFISETFHKPKNTITSFASALIFAGALGNLLDILRHDAIIDWIPLFGISVFNLADASIVVGCALVGISLFRGKKI